MNWSLIFVQGPVPDKTRSEQADWFADRSSFIKKRELAFQCNSNWVIPVCVMVCVCYFLSRTFLFILSDILLVDIVVKDQTKSILPTSLVTESKKLWSNFSFIDNSSITMFWRLKYTNIHTERVRQNKFPELHCLWACASFFSPFFSPQSHLLEDCRTPFAS